MRPLGISSYEDKLVENAITQILEQIYSQSSTMKALGSDQIETAIRQ